MESIPIVTLIVFNILALLTLDQTVRLTQFVYSVNSQYDYGRMMKAQCASNFTEYESDRFQVLANADDIKISYAYYHIILIFIVSFVITFWIALIFVQDFLKVATNENLRNFVGIINNIKSNAPYFNKAIMVAALMLSIYIIGIQLFFVIFKFANGSNIFPFLQTSNMIAYSVITSLLLITIVLGFFVVFNKSNELSLFKIFFTFAIYLLSQYFITVIYEKYTKEFNIGSQEHTRFKEFRDIKEDNIFSQFFKSVFVDEKPVFEMGIFAAAILLIWILLKFILPSVYAVNGFYLLNATDSNFVYTYTFVPFLVLVIILVLVVSNREYNKLVNTYTLDYPTYLYKIQIDKINNIFNQMIENDSADLENNSVCQNIANVVHLVLYSVIFKRVANNEETLFTPGFIYTKECDNYGYNDYNASKAYKFNDINIFFKNDNCKSVKDDLLEDIMVNFMQPEANLNKYLTFAIANITDNRIYYDNSKVLLNPKLNNKILKDIKVDLKVSDVTITKDNDQNAINIINGINRITSKFTNKKLINLIGIIVQHYEKYHSDMQQEALLTLEALCNCNNLPDITKGGVLPSRAKITEIFQTTISNYSSNIKKDFIQIFIKKTNEFLKLVNSELTSQINKTKNHKLSSLIISNYNNLQTDKSYEHNKATFDSKPNHTRFEYIHVYDEDINNVQGTSDKMFLLLHDISGKNNSDDVRLIVNDYADLLTKMRTILSIPQNKESSQYVSELANKYKSEYVNLLIASLDKILNMLKSDVNMKLDEMKKKYNTDYITELKTINYDVPKADYEHKMKTLWENINKLQEKQKLLSQQESAEKFDNTLATKLAKSTSFTVYGLIVIYIIAFVLVSLIKN